MKLIKEFWFLLIMCFTSALAGKYEYMYVYFLLNVVKAVSIQHKCAVGCPLSHPYAYLNGRHCCKTEREANRPQARDNPTCDGGRLEFKSRFS